MGKTGTKTRGAPGEHRQAVEDYAKAIFALQRRQRGPVGTTAIAKRIGVAPSSVTAMLKRLDEMGLVEHEAYKGVKLTAGGERVALEVMRHHRLIEAYLSKAFDMLWDRVHDEAEVLEHYISEELEELIAAKLGNPSVDPHGDPIPGRDLKLPADEASVPLSELQPGDHGTFTRVSDRDPEMLRYLSERGIAPGAKVEVTSRQPFGGPLFVRIGGKEHALGGELAARMRISDVGART
jgi:DtxR family Mn-dependent transcriptional regulator